MDDVCSNLILGDDFMKLRDKIVFERGGPPKF